MCYCRVELQGKGHVFVSGRVRNQGFMTNEPRKRAQRPRQTETGPQVGQGPQQEDGVGPNHEAHKHIGRMLKGFYDEVAHEPVPDKFLELLKQLEAAEPRKR
jgi:hypothetical protein